MTTEQPNDRRERKRVKATYKVPSVPASPRVKAADKAAVLPEPEKPVPAKKAAKKAPAKKSAAKKASGK